MGGTATATSRRASGTSSKQAGAAREPEGKRRLFGAPGRILGPRLLLIATVVALCAFGLVMVYSASSVTAYNDYGNASYYFDRQVTFLVLGAALCVLAAAVPYRFWSNLAVAAVVWVLAVALLALTAFSGVSALGAERSIVIGSFAIQPAEFAKIAVLLVFAALYRHLQEGRLSLPVFAVLAIVSVVVPIVLIYQQPDLGTAIILIVGVLVLMMLGGFPWYVIAGICCVAVAYVAVVCIAQPYHLTRILTMFDPWLDPTGDGYQTIQSLYAFGSGGVFGTGLGLSRQKYLYLPEAHTDFIFAIIGEELGLVGALATVLLFALFVFAGLRISRTAPDVFGCLVAGGMTAMIGFQAFVNMACVTGIAPVTGKALPFISYGGSSLVATLIMVGIVLSVSLRSKIGAANERRRDNLLVLEGGARAGASKRAGSGKRAGKKKQGSGTAPARSERAASAQRSGKRRAADGGAGTRQRPGSQQREGRGSGTQRAREGGSQRSATRSGSQASSGSRAAGSGRQERGGEVVAFPGSRQAQRGSGAYDASARAASNGGTGAKAGQRKRFSSDEEDLPGGRLSYASTLHTRDGSTTRDGSGTRGGGSDTKRR